VDFVKDSRVLLCVELYLDFMNSPFTTGQRYVGSLGNQHDDGKQDILLKIYRLTNVREIHIQPMLSVCLMKRIKHKKS